MLHRATRDMAPESKAAVVAALAGNAALALLKAVTAVMTGSAAMLAETFHSVADTGNQILLFLGMRLSQRPPDRSHPFGYGMNTYFWAFVVSTMLFTVGGAFSIWEAVHKLRQPAMDVASPAAFFVLGGAFVFEGMSLGVALHSVHAERGDAPLLRFVRESRDPTLPTVLLEDSAARHPDRGRVVPGLRELLAAAWRAGDGRAGRRRARAPRRRPGRPRDPVAAHHAPRPGGGARLGARVVSP